MGVFRDRMTRDLEIRGYAKSTVELYVAAMAALVRFHMRPPDTLVPEDLYRYQHHLVHERRVSYSTFNVAVSAFRFFYAHTVQVGWSVERIPYRRKPRRLPVITGRDEVRRLLHGAASLKHRTLLMTIYGAGLRLSEAIHLRVEDIDGGRRMLRIRSGKGAKDRYVPLGDQLLGRLRTYWRVERPQPWLFPGARADRPLHPAPCSASSRERAGVPISRRG